MMFPQYLSTNESLEGIVKSMDLNSQDIVCAILGSGDQTFAISEFVDSIAGFDIEDRAVNYVEDRIKALYQRDVEGFYGVNPNESYEFSEKVRYFSKDRCEKIRESLGKITTVITDMLEIIEAGIVYDTTNKFYFSNALSYSTKESFIERLERLRCGMKKGSLSYFADSPIPFHMVKSSFEGFRVLEENSEIASKKAREFSQLAQVNYSFNPIVLERV